MIYMQHAGSSLRVRKVTGTHASPKPVWVIAGSCQLVASLVLRISEVSTCC